MDAEDEVGRIRLLPAAVEIALARDSLDEADQLLQRTRGGRREVRLARLSGMGFACPRGGARQTRQTSRSVADPARRDATVPKHPTPLRDGTGLRVDVAGPCREAGDANGAASDAANADSIYHNSAPSRFGRPTACAPGGLTSREVEVLARIAAGASNREVAKLAVHQRKTVGRHLANIFVKLGVSSRTAAAAWAHENGVLPSM